MSILDQTVSQHCTKKVITVSPETSVCTAIELMNKSKITSVLVCEGRLPIGILTARDLPKIFAGHEHNLDNPILNLMSKPIEKCNETNTLLDALDMMINNELRHLPIVDKHNNLAGIISETDIVNALGFFNPMKHQSVNEIMDSSLIFIKPDISLSEIMILFESRGTDCLLVTNESTTIGIVTERDIPRLILSGVSPDTLAGSVMSEPIISVSTQFPVQDAIKLMLQDHIHHLVVVDQSGTTQGLISRACFLQDMTRYLIRQLVKSERLIEELMAKNKQK